jgi:hypothetical protein
VEIPLRTVDLLCAELDFRPDAMKIDVEGYELAVLRGARGTLTASRPLVFLEIHPARIAELGGSLGELNGLLAELGYQVLDLSGVLVPPARLVELDAVTRFLCRPVLR